MDVFTLCLWQWILPLVIKLYHAWIRRPGQLIVISESDEALCCRYAKVGYGDASGAEELPLSKRQ